VLSLPPDPAPLRRRLIVLLLFAGIALRLLHRDELGSDVLTVTRAAIAAVLDGANPYGHGYGVSKPPGAPFAYGPVALLWYAVMPRTIELIASTTVLFALAATQRLIGLAVCALWVPLAILANDGSNDSSVGLLLLGAMVLAERSPRLGAAALALVVAFKPYALAFLPPLVAFGGLGVLGPFVAVSLVAWGPAVALWGGDNLLTSFRMALDVHRVPYFSLAAIVHGEYEDRSVFTLVQVALGALAAVGSLRWTRTARSMVAWGIAIYGLTLFAGWWATVAYWAAVLPLMAWHVDSWFRELSPDNPISRLGADDERVGNRAAGEAVPTV
jgi:hypothetical protein